MFPQIKVILIRGRKSETQVTNSSKFDTLQLKKRNPERQVIFLGGPTFFFLMKIFCQTLYGNQLVRSDMQMTILHMTCFLLKI